ncbi:hypothetical protein DL764_010176 [Monosporascus ibericus]|uniref:Thymidylate kinase n=1 Tax=Monosporascus ibericus TaxID=155417 RepID=A0A4Q4SUZ9_9PEZI|nr:hypothetical protein DL764_010176 [Monosporascus ibericus]
MASINDLATAATIASEAVALQNSPSPAQQPQPQPQPQPVPEGSSSEKTQAQDSPPPAPKTPTAAPPTIRAATPPAAPASEKAGRSSNAVTAKLDAKPDTGASAEAVLAAPHISPQVPAQGQILVVASPPSSPSPAAEDKGAVEGMDGVEETGPGNIDRERERAKGKAQVQEIRRKPPVRGAFIVFEGMDRAGKTTQAKLLQVRFIESGREVRFMRFPDRTTPIGRMIDSYLRGQSEVEDHVIHLLFSANRWEAVNKIKAELAAGHTVICDRFYHSGIVYSAAKQLPSLSLSWAKAPEVGLPRPDVVLFLDLEEAVARRRGGWGGEVYEKGEMQRRVRELFWGLSMGDLGSSSSGNGGSGGGIGGGGSVKNTKGPSSSRRESNANATAGGSGEDGGEEEGEFRQEEEDIQIVDADMGVEELSAKVWEVVLPRLEAVERGEVGSTVRTVR